MLYIVGGVSRAGKSLLASRMNLERGTSWLSLDVLRWGLQLGAPTLGINCDNDDQADAERLWPIVEGMVEDLLFDGRDYLLEGVCLTPRLVAMIVEKEAPQIRACFLGYPHMDIEQKIEDVTNRRAPNDWLREATYPEIRAFLEKQILLSRVLRAECAAKGTAYFDTGNGFDEVLAAAMTYLTG